MAGELHHCLYCEYFSNKKYNLYRHMVSKHVNSNPNISTSNDNFPNISDNFPNIDNNFPNIDDNFPNNGNKCGKCGKKLTTPESIKSGLGPYCSNMV